MHLPATRRTATEALAQGASLSDVSRRTGVAAYAALLGFYLGDG